MDETFGSFQNAVEDVFTAAHFPQNVHVDAAFASGNIVGDAGLVDAALDGKTDQLVVAFAAGFPLVDLGNQVALIIVVVRIDTRKSADATSSGKCS